MNTICNHCDRQTVDLRNGKKECSVAYYESNDYGTFKRGCSCMFDSDLNNRFEDSTKSADDEIERRFVKLNRIISDQRHQIQVLKNRLTFIDTGE